jgi:O-succinylbenzoate synthase
LKQSSDSIDFLNQVEALAPSMNVALKTDSLEEVTDKKTGVKSIDVKFVFSGSRNSVERFINTLEHLPYLSQVTSVSLVSKDGVTVEARLAIKVFIISYAE